MTNYRNVILATNEEEYVVGKNSGKMVTVFFPVDCRYKCEFCTTKAVYNNVDIDKVREVLINIANSDIEEVVFSGGEPLRDLELLQEFVNIVSTKKVYINTCFTDNVKEAVDFINSNKCILGVNISRHSVDNVQFREDIANIQCNVRINVVGYSVNDIPKYINNWSNVKKDLNISFREDYRTVTSDNIYNFQTDTLLYLTEHYNYYSQVYCHVCNKFMFTTDTGLIIRYHRGLALTRTKIGVITEIQEFVLFPDGILCTDWDKTTDGLEEIAESLNLDLI